MQDHVFTTGSITRRSFERVLPNTFVECTRKDGIGCEMPAAHAKAEGKPTHDEHLHEHGTCFDVKDGGLVVISSCGHAGMHCSGPGLVTVLRKQIPEQLVTSTTGTEFTFGA